MLDANTIIAIGTVVVAVATWRAATAAKAAAQSTGRATQAQLFSTLMAEYGSPEMREALLRLRQTQDNWATNGLQQGIEHWADTFLEHGPIDSATDIARRRVVHFFRKTAVIMDQGLVDGGLKEELRTLSGQELMHSLLLPMEDALAVRIGGARPTRLRKLLETQFPPLLPEGE